MFPNHFNDMGNALDSMLSEQSRLDICFLEYNFKSLHIVDIFLKD